MKTAEELNALKAEVESLNKKLAELTEEDLMQITGGRDGSERESPEEVMERYRIKMENSGVRAEQRKREDYEKPSVKREKKSMAARRSKASDPERIQREAQIGAPVRID